jgi:hypothetical protein
MFVCGFYILYLHLSCGDIKGEYFITVVLRILCFALCDKKGEYLLVLDQECIFNQSSDFCPRMAKWGVC